MSSTRFCTSRWLTTRIASTRPPDSGRNSIRRSTVTLRRGTVTTPAIDDSRLSSPDTVCSMSAADLVPGSISPAIRSSSAGDSGSGASRVSTK